MKNERASREQLLSELAEMRARVADLEEAASERSRAGKALRGAVSHLRTLVENSLIGMYQNS